MHPFWVPNLREKDRQLQVMQEGIFNTQPNTTSLSHNWRLSHGHTQNYLHLSHLELYTIGGLQHGQRSQFYGVSFNYLTRRFLISFGNHSPISIFKIKCYLADNALESFYLSQRRSILMHRIEQKSCGKKVF